jgi:protein-disulfide isomerase
MSERLFEKNGAPVSDAELTRTALDVGVDVSKFTECLASGRHKQDWEASQAEGTRVGVGSTPTFYVNGRMIIGAAPYESFAAVIDDELARVSPSKSGNVTSTQK